MNWLKAEAFLKQVYSGEVKLDVEGFTAYQMAHGTVHFKASNGWAVDVYVDDFEFDYIEQIVSDLGDRIEHKALYWQEDERDVSTWIMSQSPRQLKERLDAGRYHPSEFDDKELALWTWEEPSKPALN